MLALSFLCGVNHLEHEVYARAVNMTNTALNDLAICMMNDENVDHSYKAFLENVNLRAYITRFILYHAVLQQFFNHVICAFHISLILKLGQVFTKLLP
jgi:hypothetical protein